MINTPNEGTNRLRIWQQNMNKSSAAQWTLLNSDGKENNLAKEYDIVMLQEPYLDHLGNPKATHAWRMVKPTAVMENGKLKPRAIMLINKRMSTNAWKELDMKGGGRDVVGIQLVTSMGRMNLINVYNEGTHERTVEFLEEYLGEGEKRKYRHWWEGISTDTTRCGRPTQTCT